MVRILLAKPGLDGHESGVKLVARGLRDAGYEVIYLGARQRADAIARVAVQEDVDLIGLSILTGGTVIHSQRLLEALAAVGAADIPVIVGGIISPTAAQQVRELGVSAVFGPGDSLTHITSCVRDLIDQRRLTA
jgi:methylmalonyl-CoA mutase C-terminal domain/subunit